jgi:hypothetical protein
MFLFAMTEYEDLKIIQTPNKKPRIILSKEENGQAKGISAIGLTEIDDTPYLLMEGAWDETGSSHNRPRRTCIFGDLLIRGSRENADTRIILTDYNDDEAKGKSSIELTKIDNTPYLSLLGARDESGRRHTCIFGDILIKNPTGSPAKVKVAGGIVIKDESESDTIENIIPGTIVLNDVLIRSSQKLKQNIEKLSKEEANDLITKLEPVKFAYKSDPEKNEKIGFIAEKVPDIITNKEHNHVKIMEIVSAMTKVVQEQQKSIELMTREISELKKKINNNNSIQK